MPISIFHPTGSFVCFQPSEGGWSGHFKVSPADGTLTKVGYQLTGIHPRNFTITPNGKYLLVACRDTNEIQVFVRDAETGLLQDTGKTIHTDKPVCLQWVMK